MNKGIQQSTLDFLQNVEGRKDTVYKDTGGADTVGVGHLIVLPRDQYLINEMPLSQDKIDTILRIDLIPVENSLKKTIKVPLTQNQHDALISLIFNIGTGGFEHSTLAKYINNGNKKSDIVAAWKAWNHDNGKEVEGLTKRRQKEIDLYYKTI